MSPFSTWSTGIVPSTVVPNTRSASSVERIVLSRYSLTNATPMPKIKPDREPERGVAYGLRRDRIGVHRRRLDHRGSARLELLVDLELLQLLGERGVRAGGDLQLGRELIGLPAVLDLLAEVENLVLRDVETPLNLVGGGLERPAAQVLRPSDVLLGHRGGDLGGTRGRRRLGVDGDDVRLALGCDLDVPGEVLRGLLEIQLADGGLGNGADAKELHLGLQGAFGLARQLGHEVTQERGARVVLGDEDLRLGGVDLWLNQTHRERGQRDDECGCDDDAFACADHIEVVAQLHAVLPEDLGVHCYVRCWVYCCNCHDTRYDRRVGAGRWDSSDAKSV